MGRWVLRRMFKPAGLLVDTVFDNTGDKAIRLAMEDFFQSEGIAYEVLNPPEFDVREYSRIVVGGGHLIRNPDGRYYDAFRVPGLHILNTVGVLATQGLDYLREYEYVSVRSQADKMRLAAAIADAAVVPCVSFRLKAKPLEPPLPQGTIAVQFNSESMHSCPGAGEVVSRTEAPLKLFVPMTHYNGDRELMAPLASEANRSRLLECMDPSGVLSTVAASSFVISSSLHGSIFAYINNVPFLAFDGGAGKMRDFWRDRGLDGWLFSSTRDLEEKLEKLMKSPPDYSDLIQRDEKVLSEHFRRLADTLLAAGAKSRMGEMSDDGAYMLKLQESIRRRDFATAARFREYHDQRAQREQGFGERLAELDQLGVAQKEEIAALKHALNEVREEKDTHIANFQKMVADKDALMGELEQQVDRLSEELETIKASHLFRLYQKEQRARRWLTRKLARNRDPR